MVINGTYIDVINHLEIPVYCIGAVIVILFVIIVGINIKEKRQLSKIPKMRAPNRIDPIMEKLTAVWKLHPDWRLCQLLANIAVLEGWKQADLFHFEDDELLKGIDGLGKFK